MRRLILIFSALLISLNALADGRSVTVSTLFESANITLDWSDGTLRWSASSYANYQLIAPSRLKMETSRGVWGENVGEATVREYSTKEYSGAIVEFDAFAVARGEVDIIFIGLVVDTWLEVYTLQTPVVPPLPGHLARLYP